MTPRRLLAMAGAAALVAATVAVSVVSTTSSSSTTTTAAATTDPAAAATPLRFARGVASAAPAAGDTLNAADLYPVTRPSQAAEQPTGWAARVQFKGCGQTVSVRVHTGSRVLFYNAGTVTRYLRNGGGLALPDYVGRAVVPRDWREATFAEAGQKVVTFTTASCTLWSPKVVVSVTG